MEANDDGAKVPIQVELVPHSSSEPLDSRIPGAVAAAAIAPAAAAAFFAATDDGTRPVYNDAAFLRAGGSGETYTGVGVSEPGVNSPTSSDTGADGGGD